MDNTIVAISSDHGESMCENDYYFSHAMLVNEGSIHIPLVMSHPDVKEPLVVSSLLQNTDLSPTLLGEFGVELPEEVDGKPTPVDGIDFSDVYAKGKPDLQLRPFIFSSTSFEYGTLYETVRTHSGKLIRERQVSYGEDNRGLPTVLDGESFYFYDLSSEGLDINDRFSSISDRDKKQYLSYLHSMEEALSGSAQVSNSTLSERDRKHLKALGYIN
jgi:hypothetical protein